MHALDNGSFMFTWAFYSLRLQFGGSGGARDQYFFIPDAQLLSPKFLSGRGAVGGQTSDWGRLWPLRLFLRTAPVYSNSTPLWYGSIYC